MKRPFFLAALLWVLLAAGTATGQSPAPVSLDEYRQAIDEALALVETEQPSPAANLLASISAVRLPSGETMPVDHSWFVTALQADEPDLDAVVARLGALGYELDAWPTGVPAPDAFDKLDQVLARPEFQYQTPPPNPLQEWLNRLLESLPQLPNLSWLGDLLLLAAVVVLAAVVAYFASGLWGSFVAQAEIDEADADAERLTANQALSRSREMARAGDYRIAVRLLYLATLLRLEERNLLRYDRTLTNREYLRQVANKPTLAAELRPVVDTFDEVWYGQIEPDADRYEAYARQVERVREVEE